MPGRDNSTVSREIRRENVHDYEVETTKCQSNIRCKTRVIEGSGGVLVQISSFILRMHIPA